MHVIVAYRHTRIFAHAYAYRPSHTRRCCLCGDRLSVSKDSLCRLNRLQNRAMRLTCGLWKYAHVPLTMIAGARLGWLPIAQFVQYKSVSTMFHQHYLGNGILFNSPIEFGSKYSYSIKQATMVCEYSSL